MFKGLRNRFVILHMSIVSLIVFIFFGAILISNFQNMHRKSDDMLSQADQMRRNMTWGILPGRVFESRFLPIFTVELDDNNKVIKVITSFDVEDSFYQEIANLAIRKKLESGTISYGGSYFKYKSGYGRIVFLDISTEMEMFKNTIYTFLYIAFPLLLIIFFISLYFANRSIKPVEESYNKQKEFVADASHELKTPLAVISTNVDMLLENATTGQQKWLDYIKSETVRMSELTSSLLFLTKLDYVKEQSTSAIIDLSKLIEDYIIPLEAMFYENKIKTQIDISPNVRINADSEQIRRLVGVLINNAVKYTDGNIRISLEKGENNAKLTVFNTGKGILASEIEKIWDRFYRGDKSRENTGGFGLGLPIAKAIVLKYKGSITAESKENEWTRFILKLPLEKL